MQVTHSPVRGTSLAWRAAGSGPAVLWAHGLMSDAMTLEGVGLVDWDPVTKAGRRLIRYDARGHGQSSGGRAPEEYTWPNLAADLIALADILQPHAPVDAIGCSMGTATLLHAVLVAPHRFSRLVLTAPPTAWETRSAQGAIYEGLASLVEREGVQAALDLRSNLPRPPIFEQLPELPIRVDPHILPAVLRGAGQSDLPPPERLATIDRPVLILAWEGDPTHPLSTAERLLDIVPGAELRVAASLDEVREWGDIAAEFLRR